MHIHKDLYRRRYIVNINREIPLTPLFVQREPRHPAAAGRAQHDDDADRGDRGVPLRGDPPHGHHRPPHHLLQVSPR